jgi:hypothetical protein
MSNPNTSGGERSGIAPELRDVAAAVWLRWLSNAVFNPARTPDPRTHFVLCSNSDPEAIADALLRIDIEYLAVADHAEELDRARERLSNWEGAAAEDFRDCLVRVGETLDGQKDVLGQLRTVLSYYRGLVLNTRRNLDDLGAALVDAVDAFRARQEAQARQVTMRTLVWAASGAPIGGVPDGLADAPPAVIEGDGEDDLYVSFEENAARLEREAVRVSSFYVAWLRQLREDVLNRPHRT